MTTEYYVGSDCTGSSGSSSRTLTIANSSLTNDNQFQVYLSGLLLTPTSQYTVVHASSSTVITFVVNVWDDENIAVIYSVSPTDDTDSDLDYTNVLDFCEIIQIRTDIPSWDVGGTPSNEEVGMGNGTTTIFYLDHQNVIEDSYTLYYGASASTTTELEETTEYTLDKDTGKITLTAAGLTKLSTNKIFAKYSYTKNSMKNSYLIDVLQRAESEVDKMVNSTFTNGTLTNPSYPLETEIQSSEGFWHDRILTLKRPLVDISSTLSANITASATSIALDSGDGSKFPSTGKIIIGTEVISYTGISTDTLTGCIRGVEGTTAATHSEDDGVHTTILFRSDTSEGTAVSWTVQQWDTSMYANEFGLIYKFKDESPDPLNRMGVANRIKILYYYGYDTIPQDIKRLTYLMGKRMLVQDNIGSSMIQGRNEFRPEMFDVDMNEINRIVSSYIVLPMGNT